MIGNGSDGPLPKIYPEAKGGSNEEINGFDAVNRGYGSTGVL